MELQDIQLVRLPEDPARDVLVGINGDIEINDRIARAVEESGRLFPYVVRHVAMNRMKSEGLTMEEDRTSEVYGYMRSVRDELKLCVEGLRSVRQQRQIQAENMTKNVSLDRPPYFVR